jgi:hypothetical protein
MSPSVLALKVLHKYGAVLIVDITHVRSCI